MEKSNLVDIETIGKSFRKKGLQFQLTYRRSSIGRGKKAWKWSAMVACENGAHVRSQASNPVKAITKLLKREGVLV